jgi:hypothetical protein
MHFSEGDNFTFCANIHPIIRFVKTALTEDSRRDINPITGAAVCSQDATFILYGSKEAFTRDAEGVAIGDRHFILPGSGSISLWF